MSAVPSPMARNELNVFQRLPEELRRAVFWYCDASTVLNLSLTSSATYDACIRHLWHTIDFSAHKEEDFWGIHSDYINVDVPPDHIKRSLTNRDVAILRRQRKLIRRIDENPESASETRVLRWTMMDSDPRVTFRSSLDAHNYGTVSLWRTFQFFANLTEIDLGFMTNWRELDPVPPSLFKTATSVSLAGVASHAVIRSILGSIDASKLRHLRLDNLQTFAEQKSTLLSTSDEEKEQYRMEHPGAVQGHLLPLTGRCATLRSFHYLTTAEFTERASDNFPQRWTGEVADENRRYAEIGAFLESVKSTLREFVFEQGPDIDYYGNPPGRHSVSAFTGPNHDAPLPMDAYFDAHILPVFWTGSWPKLERIVVRGIGHWKPLDPWREEATRDELRWLHRKTSEFRDRAITIWEAVDGSKVEVVISDEASRPFYRLQTDSRRSRTGTLL